MKLTDLEKREYEKYTARFDFTKYLKNKTFLITGSKGIIGSGLIRWILFENKIHGTNANIIASSRNPDSVPDYIEKGDRIRFCRFGEEEKLTCDIDYIIHTAAPTSNRVFREQPVESLSVIWEGTAKALALAKSQPHCTVIYLSSEEAYGTPVLTAPADETYVGAIDSLNVRNCYPLGKKAAELLCRSYFEEYGLDVKMIRPTVILGLFQPYDSVKVEAEILRCILEKRNLFMRSRGATKKSVIYTMDALSAVFTVLFRGQAGEAYNATNPDTYVSVLERARSAFSKYGNDVTVEFAEQDTSQAAGYLPERALQEDITKIRKLGWEPLASMDDIFSVDIERFLNKNEK